MSDVIYIFLLALLGSTSGVLVLAASVRGIFLVSSQLFSLHIFLRRFTDRVREHLC